MTYPDLCYGQKSSFNSSLKPWIETKYTIEIISVKTYKKALLFFVAKTLKDITNHSLKLAKVYSQ